MDGFKIVGEATRDYAGYSVATAGDVNGDGYVDLIVGAYVAGESFAGAAYVVFGAASPPPSINLDDIAAGTAGFKITGGNASDHAGHSVASAGDVNGDGYDDLLVGAFHNHEGGREAGAACLIYGADWMA